MTIGSLLRAIGGAIATAITAAVVTSAAKSGTRVMNNWVVNKSK